MYIYISHKKFVHFVRKWFIFYLCDTINFYHVATVIKSLDAHTHTITNIQTHIHTDIHTYIYKRNAHIEQYERILRIRRITCTSSYDLIFGIDY